MIRYVINIQVFRLVLKRKEAMNTLTSSLSQALVRRLRPLCTEVTQAAGYHKNVCSFYIIAFRLVR